MLLQTVDLETDLVLKEELRCERRIRVFARHHGQCDFAKVALAQVRVRGFLGHGDWRSGRSYRRGGWRGRHHGWRGGHRRSRAIDHLINALISSRAQGFSLLEGGQRVTVLALAIGFEALS